MGSRIGSPLIGGLGCDQAAPDPAHSHPLILAVWKAAILATLNTKGRRPQGLAGLRVRMQLRSGPSFQWMHKRFSSARENLGLANILFRYLGLLSRAAKCGWRSGVWALLKNQGGMRLGGCHEPRGRCNSCLRKRVGMENTMIAARCPCQRGTAARVCETQICTSARARTMAAVGVRGSAQWLHRGHDHLYADRELPGGRGSGDPSSAVWMKDAVWNDMLLVSSCNWISRRATARKIATLARPIPQNLSHATGLLLRL